MALSVFWCLLAICISWLENIIFWSFVRFLARSLCCWWITCHILWTLMFWLIWVNSLFLIFLFDSFSESLSLRWTSCSYYVPISHFVQRFICILLCVWPHQLPFWILYQVYHLFLPSLIVKCCFVPSGEVKLSCIVIPLCSYVNFCEYGKCVLFSLIEGTSLWQMVLVWLCSSPLFYATDHGGSSWDLGAPEA